MGLPPRPGFGRPRGRKAGRRGAARTPRRRLLLERLEDRAVPAVTVLKSFAGMNFNDTASGGEPPDTILAAGPGHVVELVNTAIRVSDKDGTALSTRELSDFFGPLGGVGQMSDPQ